MRVDPPEDVNAIERQEKLRKVFGEQLVVRDSWFVVRDSWFVVRGQQFLVN
jgi:hypothetical protein